ncbi:hypothetical protein P4B35_19490 [Pontiellaceae bacterium B12227]|nr:hypothetical protein [Pontiellaceae bacterium B12227]
MKTYIKAKLTQLISRKRIVTAENSLPNANWTPLLAVILSTLIGYATYALTSNIPVVDYCTAGAWQIFG